MTARMDYNAATPNGVKALAGVYGHIAQSGLPKTLVNLVYLRVSQINGCAYCIDMHSRDLLKEGVTVDKLVLVPAWREAGALFKVGENAFDKYERGLVEPSGPTIQLMVLLDRHPELAAELK